jgi:hypothetical protein
MPLVGASAPAHALSTDRVFPDFDNNGRADVVVSIDQEDIGNAVDAGAVDVFYGGGPLSPGFSNDQFWSQNTAGINGPVQAGGRFGDNWAAGDFNGDGFDDLAIGEWGATVDNFATAGQVHIIYGGVNGLAIANGYQHVDKATAGVTGNPAVNDQFGRSLAAGDLNGDGVDDLVVGCPRCDLGGANNPGAVYAFPGSPSGLNFVNDKFFRQGGGTGIEDQADDEDILGSSVAVGDFDNDGNADIAAGVQGETLHDVVPPINPIAGSGAFHIFYGNGTFANVGSDHQFFTEEDLGQTALPNSRLGCEFAPGDFNGDGITDLAVCADGRKVGAVTNAGSAYVLRGSGAGLVGGGGTQLWNFDTAGVRGNAITGDNFGDSLTSGDYNNDGKDDLAIAVDKRDLETVAGVDHGLVLVFPGSASLVSVNSGKYKGFTENTRGIAGVAQSNDEFGSLLQSMDINGDHFDDLYIAAAGETVSGAVKAGGLYLLPGSSRGTTSSGSKYYTQDSSKIEDVAEASDYFGGQ